MYMYMYAILPPLPPCAADPAAALPWCSSDREAARHLLALPRLVVTNMAQPSRLDQSVDAAGSDETSGLVPAVSSEEQAATTALPAGLTVAHLMIEIFYLGFVLYVLSIAGFVDRWITKNGDEYNLSDDQADEWDAFTVSLWLYASFQVFAVFGTSVAACNICRASCGGYRGDRRGTTIYLASSIISSALSMVEMGVMVHVHLIIADRECSFIYREKIQEATSWRLVHYLTSIVSAMVLGKLVFRLGAVAGSLQRLCCPSKAFPNRAKMREKVKGHPHRAGCGACGEI